MLVIAVIVAVVVVSAVGTASIGGAEGPPATVQDYGNGPFPTAKWYETAIATPSDPLTATGSLNEARAFHTATLLDDGEVLVTGGASTYHLPRGTVTSSAEVYDPASSKWHKASSMSVARYHHAATLLADGRVLVAGGWALTSNTDKSLATAELYDPATNAWKATGAMATGRATGIMASLPDGRALFAGGVDPAYKAMATAEIWSPAGGKWSATGRLPVAIMWPALAVLHDGQVLLAGGSLNAQATRVTSSSCILAPPPP
jgi:N-acetylneuraminic acid mutarotase